MLANLPTAVGCKHSRSMAQQLVLTQVNHTGEMGHVPFGCVGKHCDPAVAAMRFCSGSGFPQVNRPQETKACSHSVAAEGDSPHSTVTWYSLSMQELSQHVGSSVLTLLYTRVLHTQAQTCWKSAAVLLEIVRRLACLAQFGPLVRLPALRRIDCPKSRLQLLLSFANSPLLLLTVWSLLAMPHLSLHQMVATVLVKVSWLPLSMAAHTQVPMLSLRLC